jgi:hypothetical protein
LATLPVAGLVCAPERSALVAHSAHFSRLIHFSRFQAYSVISFVVIEEIPSLALSLKHISTSTMPEASNQFAIVKGKLVFVTGPGLRCIYVFYLEYPAIYSNHPINLPAASGAGFLLEGVA